MKKSVSKPEQNGRDNKRQRAKRHINETSDNAENIEEAEFKRQAIRREWQIYPEPSRFDSLPFDVVGEIIRYATPDGERLPSNTNIIPSLKDATDRLCIVQYNEFSHSRARFAEGNGPNPAEEAQKTELAYLLSNQDVILKGINNSTEVQACFQTLEVLFKKTFSSHIFRLREEALDELNIKIIEAKIQESKARNEGLYLCGDSCHLTRFPGQIITKHQEYFRALIGLFLGDNQLQSLPSEIGQLAVLKQLFLDKNQLQSLPPEIGQLAALEELLLANNQLQSLPPEIGQLAALQVLKLDNNQLQSLPPEMRQLAALRWLSLSNNHLQILPSEIGQLAALQMLVLENNQLQSLPDNLREDILYNGTHFIKVTKAQVLASQRKLSPSHEVEERKTLRP